MTTREAAPYPMPRVREAVLEEPAGDVLTQRLRAYLVALALPETVIEEWVTRAGEDDADAQRAFLRLRLMMADYWRQKSDAGALDDVTAVAQFRLCRWLMSEIPDDAPACLLNLGSLMAMPPIRRLSMVPESWDVTADE